MISAAGLKPDDKLFKLFLTGERLAFRKGDKIMPGDAKHIFMIEKGFVRAFNINDHGNVFTYFVYAAHDIFPTFRLFDEDPHAHYEALGDVVLYALPRATLVRAVRTNHGISTDLLRVVVRQSRMFADRIRNLEYKHAPARIIFRLLYMTERFGEQQPDGSYLVAAPISQPTIASTINASRESVSRTMEDLKSRGLIAYNSKQLVILDLAALKNQLEIVDKH